MQIIRYLALWALSFIFTSLIDAAWHLVIFRKPYAAGLRPIARMNGSKFAFNGAAGLLSQLLVVTCIVLLVLYKSGGGAWPALVVGALAGVLAVSVYGITNFALLKDWGMSVTILELIWGPVLGGLSGLFIIWLKSALIR
jgi:uncharacterized membrane protein